MAVTSEVVATAIAEQMKGIRYDKDMGRLYDIECDAPLVGLAWRLVEHFETSEPGFDKAAFVEACKFEPDPYEDAAR